MKYLMYTIYIIVYESLVIGGCGYAVFILGHSGWWWMLAVLFSLGAYSPNKFINQQQEK